jgi:phenylpyruvate tautomerase PptA (4-oxalocrotonate tautomerase family)
MDMINKSDKSAQSNKDLELAESTVGLSRRAVLKTATVAAGAMAGVSAGLAETIPAAGFGAPLVELHVPAGALTLEQKGAMIKGVTDVLLSATKLPPDQAKKLWVQLFEAAEGGWGVGGQIFVPRGR